GALDDPLGRIPHKRRPSRRGDAERSTDSATLVSEVNRSRGGRVHADQAVHNVACRNGKVSDRDFAGRKPLPPCIDLRSRENSNVDDFRLGSSLKHVPRAPSINANPFGRIIASKSGRVWIWDCPLPCDPAKGTPDRSKRDTARPV